jgi:glycosyltransferase involved in cell wall biosynthesis
MSRHRISVVLPVYNGAGWIEECVRSLLRQSVPAHEIIVVNDGSTDATAAVLAGLPVRVVELRANRGRASARNAGWQTALGDLVVFAEDDGYYPERYLELLAAPFDDAGVAGAMGPYRVHRATTFVARCRDAERAIHFSRFTPYSAWAYRTADLRRVGGFDEDLEIAEDIDLGRRIQERCGRLVCVPGAIWYHREPTSLRAFLRRRFRAGAGALLHKLRTRRGLVPARAVALLVALPALAVATAAAAAARVEWAPAVAAAVLPLLPPLARGRFLLGAPRAGVSPLLTFAWTYLELAGWAAAFAGSMWALMAGPARVQRRLRGR